MSCLQRMIFTIQTTEPTACLKPIALRQDS